MTLQTYLDAAEKTKKLDQFRAMLAECPEHADMDVLDFLRSALRQVDCPNCVNGLIWGKLKCHYCLAIGTVDAHLVVNVGAIFHMAQDYRHTLNVYGK